MSDEAGSGVAPWLAVLLEEYKTLRTEILTSIQAQQSALGFGAATVGLLAAAAFNLYEDSPALASGLFLGAVPVACYLSLATWLAELIRMFRAGCWIRGLERRINSRLDEPELLMWENWAHLPHDSGTATLAANPVTPRAKGHADIFNVETIHFVAIATGYLVIAAASLVIGSFNLLSIDLLSPATRWDVPNVFLLLMPVLGFGLLVVVVIVALTMYRRADEFRRSTPGARE